MEWNPDTLQFLSQCFVHSLSPNPEPRRHAESNLAAAADRDNFGLATLRLVAEPAVDEFIRQAAAVCFKNHLWTRWVPVRPVEPNRPILTPISESERNQIKALIVPLMLSSSPRIKSQLSEALAVISKQDFPNLWPTLLPELVSSLISVSEASEYASLDGILCVRRSF